MPLCHSPSEEAALGLGKDRFYACPDEETCGARGSAWPCALKGPLPLNRMLLPADSAWFGMRTRCRALVADKVIGQVLRKWVGTSRRRMRFNNGFAFVERLQELKREVEQRKTDYTVGG